MQGFVNVSDMKNPQTGLTYREENLKKTHSIPIGSLVEITYNDPDQEQNEYGLRLFVAEHTRDCDGTPLYGLTHMVEYSRKLLEDTIGKDSIVYRSHFSHGHAEDGLKLIRLPDGEYPKPQLITGYIVHGSTGCTCCKDNNFVDGIFDTLEEAMENAESHLKHRRVSSQYSRTGIYTIKEIEYEQLTDGRTVLEGTVFEDRTSLYHQNDLAAKLEYRGKSHGHLGSYDKQN